MLGRDPSKSKVHLAMIGCGAVAELCHLPAAKVVSDVEIVAVVDKNPVRAKEVADRFGIGCCTDDYHQLPTQVEGVIVGLPNYLHASVTIEFLKKGIPVLIEKPMALTVKEAVAMVKTADANGVALQVGLMYHFCNGARLVKRAIDEGWLGAVQSFTVEWCFVYDWPVASRFIFSREQAGGGVLVDFGSHVLDLLLWWLGDVVDVEYKDDSLGGVEAECWLSLVLQAPTGPVRGTVTLSRLRRLAYTARIVGERFTIECDISGPTTARIWPSTSDGQDLAFVLDSGSLPPQLLTEAYAEQLQAFAHTISTGSKPIVPGESVLGSVALIERCYRERELLEMPWLRPVVPTQ